MKIRVFAVIDTNVLVSAAMSSDGFSCDIFDLIETGNVIPIFDKRMLNEYYNVLNYPKFKGKFDKNDIYNILFRIVNYGMMINDVEKAKEELIDRSDIPFFEVKESSEDLESYLVTGNIKHFPKSNSTVTPHTMLGIMNYMDRFLTDVFNYDKIINELKQAQISNGKYTSGEDLIDKMFNVKEKTIKKAAFEYGD